MRRVIVASALAISVLAGAAWGFAPYKLMLSHEAGDAGDIALWTNLSTWAQPLAILTWLCASGLILSFKGVSVRARFLLGLLVPILGLGTTLLVDNYLFSDVEHLGGVLSPTSNNSSERPR
jgi:hypothetical protein